MLLVLTVLKVPAAAGDKTVVVFLAQGRRDVATGVGVAVVGARTGEGNLGFSQLVASLVTHGLQSIPALLAVEEVLTSVLAK